MKQPIFFDPANRLYFSPFLSHQESKKHLAGLGSLGLGSLITEITANEEDSREESKNSGNDNSWLNIQNTTDTSVLPAKV